MPKQKSKVCLVSIQPYFSTSFNDFFYLLNIIDGIKIRRALSKIESLWIGRYFIFVTLASSSQLMSKYLSKIFSFLFFEEGGTLQNRIFMNSYFIFITLASSLQLIYTSIFINRIFSFLFFSLISYVIMTGGLRRVHHYFMLAVYLEMFYSGLLPTSK